MRKRAFPVLLCLPPDFMTLSSAVECKFAPKQNISKKFFFLQKQKRREEFVGSVLKSSTLDRNVLFFLF